MTWSIVTDVATDLGDRSEAARNLTRWLDRGGYVPTGTTREAAVAYCADVLREARRPQPHRDGVDLWDCPCRECTTLDWEATRDAQGTWKTLSEWRTSQWPEFYGHQGGAR